MDISHGIPFASPMKIYAGDYDDVADAAIVVISAGAGQKFCRYHACSCESGRYPDSGSHKVIRTSRKQGYWIGYCVR